MSVVATNTKDDTAVTFIGSNDALYPEIMIITLDYKLYSAHGHSQSQIGVFTKITTFTKEVLTFWYLSIPSTDTICKMIT